MNVNIDETGNDQLAMTLKRRNSAPRRMKKSRNGKDSALGRQCLSSRQLSPPVHNGFLQ